VKVVQRLPVRIELKNLNPAEYPLHGGLSASVDVDTRYERHLFGSNTWQAPPAPAAPASATTSELAAAQ
jgi:multidrug resistance efflux pump